MYRMAMFNINIEAEQYKAFDPYNHDDKIKQMQSTFFLTDYLSVW